MGTILATALRVFRGEFHGLTQTAHLHTLPGVTGGVLTLFNVTEYAKDVACDIPLATIGANANIAVGGAASEIIDGAVRIQAALPPMSPLVVGLGAAAAAV